MAAAVKSFVPSVKARKLRDLAGIGSSIEKDLHALGIQSVEQLAGADGQALYDRLCELTQTRQDPCVLDTLRCGVAQARDAHLSSEQCQWWWWSRQRKAGKI